MKPSNFQIGQRWIQNNSGYHFDVVDIDEEWVWIVWDEDKKLVNIRGNDIGQWDFEYHLDESINVSLILSKYED